MITGTDTRVLLFARNASQQKQGRASLRMQCQILNMRLVNYYVPMAIAHAAKGILVILESFL